MTSTTVQQSVSTEELKQALYALIEDKNSEFLQFITNKLEKKSVIAPKKAKKKSAPKIIFPPKKERIPYSEMPFWKANPHLKPIEVPPNPNKNAFLEAIFAFATNPETQLTDEMIEGIDDI